MLRSGGGIRRSPGTRVQACALAIELDCSALREGGCSKLAFGGIKAGRRFGAYRENGQAKLDFSGLRAGGRSKLDFCGLKAGGRFAAFREDDKGEV